MRKLIAFDEDTFDKLKQLGRDRMATFQELADEAFADLLKKHGIPHRSPGRVAQERQARRRTGQAGRASEVRKGQITMTDRDPFAEGERAARDNIPAEANPYSDGSDEHALWAAGHEKGAGAMEARESEGS
ncbi:hypothetical protein ABIE79_003687 [Bradyrhizobium diazoefficiens]